MTSGSALVMLGGEDRAKDMSEPKRERVHLVARISPEDHSSIVNRARKEGRSIGEMISIMRLETEMLRRLEQREKEVAHG